MHARANLNVNVLDGCSPEHSITAWYDALQTSLRLMMIENCGGNHQKWSPPTPEEVLAHETCPYHMFRVSQDIAPNFYSIMHNLQAMTKYQDRVRPALRPHNTVCWAYGDMLQIGNNIPFAELFASPLRRVWWWERISRAY